MALTELTLTIVACAGQLVLAFVALWRGARSPLGMPLALLAIVQFSWGISTALYALSGTRGWAVLAAACQPLLNALALHFVLTFVGRRRALARLLYASYAIFGTMAVLAAASLLFPALHDVALTNTWAMLHLGMSAFAVALIWTFLWMHRARVQRADERFRTQVLLYAFVAWAVFGVTETLAVLTPAAPRLGMVGALISNMLLAFVVLRARLFGHDLTTGSVPILFVVTSVAVVAYVGVFRSFSERTGLMVGATVLLTLSLVATARRVLIPRAVAMERLQQLATLGRFSAQMAHDLKNPLGALKGAAQYLKQEQTLGHRLDDKGEFLDLMLEQIERLNTVVERYKRMSRVDPVLAPTEVNALVQRVLALQELGSGGAVKVETRLAKDLPVVLMDGDLVAGALENLVRNAMEAMPAGGVVRVSTLVDFSHLDEPWVALCVRDNGEGMDARTQERVFDDFYTTKASGSGMGLAFVKRVVHAHGGELRLTSKEGEGSEFRLSFPPRPPHPVTA